MSSTCTGILAALALCVPTPEPPPTALPIAAEQPAGQCLTKSQARAIYKTSHLYWHTAAHCWDDKRSGGRSYPAPPHRAAPTTSSKPPLASADPNGNRVGKTPATIIYPVLIQAQAAVAADIYAMQQPITQWPLLLDIDALGPDPDNGIDGCCWPPMETLR